MVTHSIFWNVLWNQPASSFQCCRFIGLTNICCRLSAFRPSPPVVCRLPRHALIVHLSPSTIHRLSSGIDHPPSTDHRPPITVHSPTSNVHRPPPQPPPIIGRVRCGLRRCGSKFCSSGSEDKIGSKQETAGRVQMEGDGGSRAEDRKQRTDGTG